jgi:ubiquinone/menaquinone biosynthesis C-methylase UbiE
VIAEHLRLLGDVTGRRILELGFAESCSALELAGRGAVVVGVDPSASRVAAVRQAAEEEGQRLELHVGDLAELAFIGADSVDAVLSDRALDSVPDFDRVLRQAHRVLHPDGILLLTLPHPAAGPGSYFESRTFGRLFASLLRANYRLDTLLEPSPWLVVRARKLGL